VAAKTLSWDYREQPDIKKLAAAVAQVSRGTVRIREYETGSDQYVIVIADRVVDDNEVRALLRGEELPGDTGCTPACWTPVRCPACGSQLPPRSRSVPLEANIPDCCDEARMDPDINPRHLWNEEEAGNG
jgi:hypothetical protein